MREGARGNVPRIGVEAALEGDWAHWLGDGGEFVGMTGFGASAPAEVLYREFGITAEAVATAALRCLAPKAAASMMTTRTTRGHDGTYYPEAIAGPRRRTWLRRAGLQHQQYGAGACDHGSGRSGRCARHHSGLARRARLRQRRHAVEDDRGAGSDVSADSALPASGPWQRGIDLRHRDQARIYVGHDGRFAEGRRQDAGGL